MAVPGPKFKKKLTLQDRFKEPDKAAGSKADDVPSVSSQEKEDEKPAEDMGKQQPGDKWADLLDTGASTDMAVSTHGLSPCFAAVYRITSATTFDSILTAYIEGMETVKETTSESAKEAYAMVLFRKTREKEDLEEEFRQTRREQRRITNKIKEIEEIISIVSKSTKSMIACCRSERNNAIAKLESIYKAARKHDLLEEDPLTVEVLTLQLQFLKLKDECIRELNDLILAATTVGQPEGMEEAVGAEQSRGSLDWLSIVKTFKLLAKAKLFFSTDKLKVDGLSNKGTDGNQSNTAGPSGLLVISPERTLGTDGEQSNTAGPIVGCSSCLLSTPWALMATRVTQQLGPSGMLVMSPERTFAAENEGEHSLQQARREDVAPPRRQVAKRSVGFRGTAANKPK